jgi:hypothetical protein
MLAGAFSGRWLPRLCPPISLSACSRNLPPLPGPFNGLVRRMSVAPESEAPPRSLVPGVYPGTLSSKSSTLKTVESVSAFHFIPGRERSR